MFIVVRVIDVRPVVVSITEDEDAGTSNRLLSQLAACYSSLPLLRVLPDGMAMPISGIGNRLRKYTRPAGSSLVRSREPALLAVPGMR